MLYKSMVAVVVGWSLSAVGFAQVVYEPVVSQYRVGSQTFYYAGSSRRVLNYATQTALTADRDHSPIGRPGEGYLRTGLIGRPAQTTYRDDLPRQNAIVYGYTSTDARNDAYAAVPRYFRMADLTAQATRSTDGMGTVVSPTARGTIEIRPMRKAGPATAPATQPKPVLIIPKSVLEPVI